MFLSVIMKFWCGVVLYIVEMCEICLLFSVVVV